MPQLLLLLLFMGSVCCYNWIHKTFPTADGTDT